MGNKTIGMKKIKVLVNKVIDNAKTYEGAWDGYHEGVVEKESLDYHRKRLQLSKQALLDAVSRKH